MAYAHAQMLLYRPFLHYLSPRLHVSKLDKRSYACAAACVSVARNIVHITGEMKRRGLLVGAYWFTIYTTFFAILTLVFVALDNQDSQTTNDVLRDAYEGKETLARLAKRNMAADRCSTTLKVSLLWGGHVSKMTNGLKAAFEQLPAMTTKERQGSVSLGKKRPAPEPAFSQAAENYPDVTQTKKVQAQRILAFPSQLPGMATQNSFISQPSFHQQGDSSRHSTSSLSAPYGLYGTASMAQDPTNSTPSSYSLTPQSNFSMTPQQHLQQFNASPGLTDLAAMMFPSTDPFEYPNQPLCALESRYPPDPRVPFSAGAHPAVTSNQITAPMVTDFGLGDDMDVQLYGPLPPYLVQGQQPGLRINIGGELSGQDSFVQGLQDRTAGFQGMNLDDLFGGQDWNWRGGKG